MSRDKAWDVVVVGGGPAGAATAALLAARHWRVLVIDKARFPRDKPCAELASPGVEIVLRRIGAWEAVQALRPRRLRGMQLIGPSGERFAGTYPRGQALALPRPQLDQALLAVAQRRGATVWEGTRAHDLLREGQRVSGVSAATGSSPARQVAARLVIGADGLHSTVARQADAIRPGWWPHRTGLVTHCEHIDGLGALASYGEMHVRPGAYVGLAPLPGGRVNVALVLPGRQVRQRGKDIEALFWHELAQFPALGSRLARAQRTKPLLGTGPLRRRGTGRCRPGVFARRRCGRVPRPVHRRRDLPGAARGRACCRGGGRRAAYPGRGRRRARRLLSSAATRIPPQRGALSARAGVHRLLRPCWNTRSDACAAGPELGQTLMGALGDTHSPWTALAPTTLATLLRP